MFYEDPIPKSREFNIIFTSFPQLRVFFILKIHVYGGKLVGLDCFVVDWLVVNLPPAPPPPRGGCRQGVRPPLRSERGASPTTPPPEV